MKSFVKINLGNEVFDSNQSIKGIVTQINHKSGVAEISVIPSTENEKVLCRLSDLTIINSRKEEENLEIKVKYFNKESTRLSKISQGDWIDLRASETISIKKGEFKLIPLGVAMKLPDGYEAIVAPRSSTFKNFGVIETNSIGI